MIVAIIRGAMANRGLVLLAALALALWGVWSVFRTPLDALPDLSDTQVIIRTEWPGQPPRIIEDQVTYPLSTTMLAVRMMTWVRSAAIRSSATRSSMCCSTTTPTCTGRARACWST